MKNLFSLFVLFPVLLINLGGDTPKEPSLKSISPTTVETVHKFVSPIPLKRAFASNMVIPKNEGPVWWDAITYDEVICVSNNGKYTLRIQTDGNLVLYKQGTSSGLWSSGTALNLAPPYHNTASFTHYGTIELTNHRTHKYWDSMIPANTAFYWILQDDGNFVRYNRDNGQSISTRTHGGKKSRRDHFID